MFSFCEWEHFGWLVCIGAFVAVVVALFCLLRGEVSVLGFCVFLTRTFTRFVKKSYKEAPFKLFFAVH